MGPNSPAFVLCVDGSLMLLPCPVHSCFVLPVLHRTWAYNDGSRGRGLECAGQRAEKLPDAYRDGDTLGFLLDVQVRLYLI